MKNYPVIKNTPWPKELSILYRTFFGPDTADITVHKRCMYVFANKKTTTTEVLILFAKISPTYPWTIPRTFHQQLMFRIFFLCGGERGSLGAHLPRGPCGENHGCLEQLGVVAFQKTIEIVQLNSMVVSGSHKRW